MQTESEPDTKPKEKDRLALMEEDIKAGLKELAQNMVETNRQMVESAKATLLEAQNASKDQRLEQYKEEQKTKLVELLNDFNERIHRDIEAAVSDKLRSAKEAEHADEAKTVEKLKKLMAEQTALWDNKITNLEGELQQVIQYKYDSAQAVENSRRHGSSDVPPQPQAQPPPAVGLQLHFASFLNLSNVKDIFESAPANCKAYIVGVKNSFGAVELASLIHELKGAVCSSIETVTLDHMYFKDLSPFTHLLQNAGNLRTLELCSCPFTSSQVQYILGKIAEHGRGIRRLAIENAMLGDQADALAQALNKTNIREVRIVNPKGNMAKYIATFKEAIA
ncbi:MAG: hypothetical protein FJY85_23875, partial [Deltaproteobacteria bacterium]|nr:hypothetical protein [Deltaproteobacteria bacterium]